MVILRQPSDLAEKIGDSALRSVVNYPASMSEIFPCLSARQPVFGSVRHQEMDPGGKSSAEFALNTAVKFLGALWDQKPEGLEDP